MGRFDYVLEWMKTRTQEERLDTLRRAGIIDADGELADHYCTKKQLREKKLRRYEKQFLKSHVMGKNHAGLV